MDEQNQAVKPSKSNLGPIVAIVGIIVIVVVGVIAYQGMNKPQNQAQTTTEQTTQQTTQQTESAQPSEKEVAQAEGYKDGTYTAVGDYTSPGGAETIGVTLTIADGVVTDSQVEVQATRPISKTKQTEFSENYKTQVVGKNIDEINLSKVAGSSLSPKGFNDAVEKIKADAQA